MNTEKIYQKFGDNYLADEKTFLMGIDIRITSKIAERFKNRIVLETCTGAGFTTVALAKASQKVISIDVSKKHLDQARHNIELAGAESKVDLVNGSSLDDDILKKVENINAAFLDPDWNLVHGETGYKFRHSNTKPESDILFNKISKITENIAMILAPFVNENELHELPVHEKQKIYLDGEFALICLYFGDLMNSVGETELSV